MPRPGYKDLGISSREYEEALLLERLFKLVKKNPCSTCLLKKPTHIDLDRHELVCTGCSKRCSSKVQIGKGLISTSDLERLEALYGKSKKKSESKTSKHKKHTHKPRSPSLSSFNSYDKYKKHSKYEASESDSTAQHRSKPKHKPRKEETYRQHPQEYYPETYDKYPHHGLTPEGYPKLYNNETYTYPPKEKTKPKLKEKREKGTSREEYTGREYGSREYERPRGYPELPSYGYKSRYAEQYREEVPPYKYGQMTRNQTTYEYPTSTRRDVPGMMGLLANQGRGQDLIRRNQYAAPALEDRTYRNVRELRPKSLALTNGLQPFRSVPANREEKVNNNPFARRSQEKQNYAYDFTNLRESLNPPKPRSQYRETYQPREFMSAKTGNPGFPDSSANYYSRY